MPLCKACQIANTGAGEARLKRSPSSRRKYTSRLSPAALKFVGPVTAMADRMGRNATDDAALANRPVGASSAGSKGLWHGATVVAKAELGGADADDSTIGGARDTCA